MDKELKSKWIEALRSGEYKQGKGTLRRNGEYCCLGVLCDISGRGHWDGDTYHFKGYSSPSFLPATMDILTGLTGMTVLTRMNDQAGSSYAEIADYIEANL